MGVGIHKKAIMLRLWVMLLLGMGLFVGVGTDVASAGTLNGKMLTYFNVFNDHGEVISYTYSKDGVVSEGTTIPDGVSWAVVTNYKTSFSPFTNLEFMYSKDGQVHTVSNASLIPADARWATISKFVIFQNPIKDQYYQYSTDGITIKTSSSVPVDAVWATLADCNNGWSARISNQSFTFYTRTDILPPIATFTINNGQERTNQELVTLQISTEEQDSVKMRFSNNGVWEDTWEDLQSSKEWALEPGDGEKTVYLQLRDEDGNIANLQQTIILDKTAPAISGAANGGVYQNFVTLLWNEGTGVLDGNQVQSGHGVKKNGMHTLVVTDEVGNTMTITFTIAIPAPTVDLQINQGDEYTNNTRVILKVSVTNAVGNLSMRQSNNSEVWTDWDVFKADVNGDLVDGDGLKTVYVEVIDEAGNTVIASDTIELDTQTPIVTGVKAGENYDAPVLIDWNEGTAQLDNKPLVRGSIVKQNGQHTLVVTDEAGNQTSISFTLMVSAPTVAMLIDQGAEYTNQRNVTLGIQLSEELGSQQIRLSHDKKTWGPWEPIQESKSWQLTEGDGMKTVYLGLRDESGNVITTLDTIILDTTAPIVTGAEDGGIYQESLTITFNEGTATLNGTPFQSGETVGKSGSYTLVVTDKAQLVTRVEFRLDLPKTEGTLKINNGDQETTSQSVTLSMALANPADGVQMRFSNDNKNWTPWEPFATTKPWTLTSGDGKKSVYLELRDKFSQVFATNDTILLSTWVPPQPAYFPVTQVQLDQHELKLSLDAKPVTLKATVLPAYATNKSVTWSSSDPAVAEVDQNGKVIPKAEGSARITVTTVDGNKTAVAKVQVTQQIQLEFSPQIIRMKPKATAKVQVYAVSAGQKTDITKNKETRYEVEGTLVTWKAGKIQAGKKEGKTHIKVSYKGETAILPVTVSSSTVSSLESSQKQAVMETKEELPIKITALFTDKSKEDVTKEVEWSVEDDDILSVSPEGLIQAHKSGETRILAEYAGKKLEIKVLVMDEKKPTEIKLNSSNVKLKVKKTSILTLTALYPNGFEEDITEAGVWTSDDKKIATVKKGVVTAKSVGTTVIRAKYKDLKAEATLTVKK